MTSLKVWVWNASEFTHQQVSSLQFNDKMTEYWGRFLKFLNMGTQEDHGRVSGWSIRCCLIWRSSDSWPWVRCRPSYCKTGNHSISQIVIMQRDSTDISNIILKTSRYWHTRCWWHSCERRTCWWKDGLEPAMVWCDKRIPDAAFLSPCPQTWSNQQVLPRRLENILIWWARSETVKKSNTKISRVLRVEVAGVCERVFVLQRYMQNVIQRV